MAHVLTFELQQLALEFGIEHLGFLTLTFRENLVELKRAQGRFHSLNTHVIKGRYKRAIGVWERQKRGAVHFHLVVVLDADIRTGFDFEAAARGDYRSASQALHDEWRFWRGTAPSYGFGRTELLPVKSTADGLAKYVGKYVTKHIEQRDEADKGARCVRFIGYAGKNKEGERVSLRRGSCRLAWAGGSSRLWREKLRAFAASVDASDMEELKRLFGPRWAYNLQDTILATTVPGESAATSPGETAKDKRHENTERKHYHLRPGLRWPGMDRRLRVGLLHDPGW